MLVKLKKIFNEKIEDYLYKVEFGRINFLCGAIAVDRILVIFFIVINSFGFIIALFRQDFLLYSLNYVIIFSLFFFEESSKLTII
jgi:hypothetical protein